MNLQKKNIKDQILENKSISLFTVTMKTPRLFSKP